MRDSSLIFTRNPRAVPPLCSSFPDLSGKASQPVRAGATFRIREFFKPEKILALEEDEVDRRALASLFSARRAKTFVRGFDREGLATLRAERPFSAIILSFSWSPRVALRLLRILVRDFPQTPVLVLGDFLLRRWAEDFKAAGAKAVLLKPFSAGLIFAELDRCLEAQPAAPICLRKN